MNASEVKSVTTNVHTLVWQVSLEREKTERAAVERQLAERMKELTDLQTRSDAHNADVNARSATQFA